MPPGNQTAEQLLARAQSEFDQAQAALEAGNLGEYQRHVAAASDRKLALEDVGWAVLNSKEFLFQH